MPLSIMSATQEPERTFIHARQEKNTRLESAHLEASKKLLLGQSTSAMVAVDARELHASAHTAEATTLSLLQTIEKRTAFLDHFPRERDGSALARLLPNSGQLSDVTIDTESIRTNIVNDPACGVGRVALPNRGRTNHCDCRTYRNAQKWTLQLGWTTLRSETVETTEHHPCCRYATTITANTKNTNRVLAAQWGGLQSVVDIALKISCEWRDGTAALSICPSVSYIARVNRQTSPAFQVMDVLRDMLDNRNMIFNEAGSTEIFQNQVAQIITQGLWKLRLSFRRRRARLTDVDNLGNGLIHDYIRMVSPVC